MIKRTRAVVPETELEMTKLSSPIFYNSCTPLCGDLDRITKRFKSYICMVFPLPDGLTMEFQSKCFNQTDLNPH